MIEVIFKDVFLRQAGSSSALLVCHDLITWINLNIVQQRSAGGQHHDQTINSIVQLVLPVVSSFLVNTETWKPRSPIFGASGGNNKIKSESEGELLRSLRCHSDSELSQFGLGAAR